MIIGKMSFVIPAGLGTTTNGTKWRPASTTSWAASAGSNTMERCPSKISTAMTASVKSHLSRLGRVNSFVPQFKMFFHGVTMQIMFSPVSIKGHMNYCPLKHMLTDSIFTIKVNHATLWTTIGTEFSKHEHEKNYTSRSDTNHTVFITQLLNVKLVFCV